MSYRPEGWKNHWDIGVTAKDRDLYEAGADAMLEALKAKSCKYTARELWDCEALYIPEGEEDLDKVYFLIATPEEEQ